MLHVRKYILCLVLCTASATLYIYIMTCIWYCHLTGEAKHERYHRPRRAPFLYGKYYYVRRVNEKKKMSEQKLFDDFCFYKCLRVCIHHSVNTRTCATRSAHRRRSYF
jgi:hypothetical protein